MGNTANNNWPYPESTDLVKDGATAIENLADAIDTTLGVFVPSNPGLTLINTTSFSGVSSISLPASTFTSTYRNYKIIIDANASADSYIQMRMRASGTDNTAANYGSGFIYQETNVGAANPSKDVQGNNTSTSWFRVGYFITGDNPYQFDIFQPQISGKTYGTFAQSRNDGITLTGAFIHTGTVSFDSMTIYPTSGTITGSVKAYGYNQ
jgi:hypothetical protein